jgi:hypothetical protein
MVIFTSDILVLKITRGHLQEQGVVMRTNLVLKMPLRKWDVLMLTGMGCVISGANF